MPPPLFFLFFFFNDTATTEIYTLSLHDALPIFDRLGLGYDVLKSIRPDIIYIQQSGLGSAGRYGRFRTVGPIAASFAGTTDRKSTRLNSSHTVISYAVFCLKKKKHERTDTSQV